MLQGQEMRHANLQANPSMATMKNWKCKFGFLQLVLKRQFLNISFRICVQFCPITIQITEQKMANWQKKKYTINNINKQNIWLNSKTFSRLIFRKSEDIWDFENWKTFCL